MPCYRFKGLTPVVDPTSFVHPTASLIGDVLIGPHCYIGASASLRGDFGRIEIEGDTSVQDNVTLHCSAESDCRILRGATIGHGAVAHGCIIGADTLVGINAVVLDGAVIGAESLIAALSLVKSNEQFPERSLIAGNPAKLIRSLSETAVSWKTNHDSEYIRLAATCLLDLHACEPLAAAEPDRPRIQSNAASVRINAARDVAR